MIQGVSRGCFSPAPPTHLASIIHLAQMPVPGGGRAGGGRTFGVQDYRGVQFRVWGLGISD